MTFKKGDPRPKGAGRQPGTVSKKDLLVRHILEANDICLVSQILARVKELPTRQAQIDVLLKLMPYVHPQLSAMQIQNLSAADEDRKLKDIPDAALDTILIEATKPRT